jgi:RNA polymerase sigma factor (TIGR02999 family)
MVPAGEPTEVTVLLRRWREGDSQAYDLLISSVYQRLLAIAAGVASGDRFATSPTGLVSEAYLRLRQLQRIEWKDRDHFFSFAATQMRRILIEHARRRMAAKRGGPEENAPVPLHLAWNQLPGPALLDLDAALERLAETDAGMARLVELHYVLGYSVPEVCELTGVSDATIERHLRFARAWLSSRLRSVRQ